AFPAPGRQRGLARACAALVPRNRGTLQPQERSRPRRGRADRAVWQRSIRPAWRGRGMNAPLEPAHSPFGGSVATRVLRCPASVGLVEKVPAPLRKSSAYAERGTALHQAMALLLDNDDDDLQPEDLINETIGGYKITADDTENALRP